MDPRPYQLVPLLLALRQETVRLLIADDVGIGKTIEAGLIAAELLAQGSAERLAVLCPPSLAEQWQDELRTKFGLEPGTRAARHSPQAGARPGVRAVDFRAAPGHDRVGRLHQVGHAPR